jgi:hypothetical protein
MGQQFAATPTSFARTTPRNTRWNRPRKKAPTTFLELKAKTSRATRIWIAAPPRYAYLLASKFMIQIMPPNTMPCETSHA